MEKENVEKEINNDQKEIDTNGPILSKNQLKKMKRKEKWENEKETRKKIKKEKEKEKRKKKNELISKQSQDKPVEIIMKEPKKLWEEKLKLKMENGIKICIDCDFENLMTEKEIISMSRQITEIYSRNKKSTNPFMIILLGLGDKLFDYLRKNGFEKWLGIKYFLKSDENNFLSENNQKLIYLSGDSENTLEKLDPDNIYLIGGIVDRNRHKFLTLNKAKELNINHAKLPLGDFIDLKSSKVLATNHVFDILSYYNSVNPDWKESFMSIIPQRKLDKE